MRSDKWHYEEKCWKVDARYKWLLQATSNAARIDPSPLFSQRDFHSGLAINADGPGHSFLFLELRKQSGVESPKAMRGPSNMLGLGPFFYGRTLVPI